MPTGPTVGASHVHVADPTDDDDHHVTEVAHTRDIVTIIVAHLDAVAIEKGVVHAVTVEGVKIMTEMDLQGGNLLCVEMRRRGAVGKEVALQETDLQ